MDHIIPSCGSGCESRCRKRHVVSLGGRARKGKLQPRCGPDATQMRPRCRANLAAANLIIDTISSRLCSWTSKHPQRSAEVINEILQNSKRLPTEAVTFPPCFSWRRAVGLTRSMTPSLLPALVQLSTSLPAGCGLRSHTSNEPNIAPPKLIPGWLLSTAVVAVAGVAGVIVAVAICCCPLDIIDPHMAHTHSWPAC